MSVDGLWLHVWPYQRWLPRHPVEEPEPDERPGRTPGWVDESN